MTLEDKLRSLEERLQKQEQLMGAARNDIARINTRLVDLQQSVCGKAEVSVEQLQRMARALNYYLECVP